MLTRYAHARAGDAPDLGQALLAGIEARTRVIHGIREPVTDTMSRLDYNMVTCRGGHEPP